MKSGVNPLSIRYFQGEAIEALFGDKADEVVLYLLDAIKDPFLRAIMYTRASEYKEQQKK